jgi:putative membrane protein
MQKTLALILSLALAPAALADDTKPMDEPKATETKPAGKVKLTDSELQVVAHYHAVNQLEVDLGKAAQKRSANAGVKQYGAMLVKDHGDADKKLVTFAKKSGQKIPAEKPATEAEKQDKADLKAKVAKLKTLKGAEFDKLYLTMMIEGHEKELANIDAKIADVENAELADMLKAKKPVLQHHADHARELQKVDAQAMR